MKKIAYLQLHRICDQECIFCAQPSNGAVLNFQNIKNQVDTYKEEWYSKIIFSWGEPSLNKDFFQVISYVQSLWIEMTILSNGHMFENFDFAKKSLSLGLVNYHISLHSHIPAIHDKLVMKAWWLKRCCSALRNLLFLGAHVSINVTINAYNVSYFDKLILSIIKTFPQIEGFIINNLETSQIPENHHHVIAQLDQMKTTIPKSLQIIIDAGKRVRIERIPMCYIRWYEYLSTDLEYTQWDEQKYLHYLGEMRNSGELNKNTYLHDSKYSPSCSRCDLYGLCAWMEWLHKHYNPEDLFPQVVSEEEKNQILIKFHEVFQ